MYLIWIQGEATRALVSGITAVDRRLVYPGAQKWQGHDLSRPIPEETLFKWKFLEPFEYFEYDATTFPLHYQSTSEW